MKALFKYSTFTRTGVISIKCSLFLAPVRCDASLWYGYSDPGQCQLSKMAARRWHGDSIWYKPRRSEHMPTWVWNHSEHQIYIEELKHLLRIWQHVSLESQYFGNKILIGIYDLGCKFLLCVSLTVKCWNLQNFLHYSALHLILFFQFIRCLYWRRVSISLIVYIGGLGSSVD